MLVLARSNIAFINSDDCNYTSSNISSYLCTRFNWNIGRFLESICIYVYLCLPNWSVQVNNIMKDWWSNMKYEQIPEELLKELGVEKQEELEQCHACQEETYWKVVYYGTHCCSTTCANKMTIMMAEEVERLIKTIDRLEIRVNQLLERRGKWWECFLC